MGGIMWPGASDTSGTRDWQVSGKWWRSARRTLLRVPLHHTRVQLVVRAAARIQSGSPPTPPVHLCPSRACTTGVAAAAGKSPWSRSEGDSKRGGAAGRGSSGSNGGGGGRGGSKPKKQRVQ
jgi:hypothetical protein